MKNIFLISLFLFVGIFTDLSAQNYNITFHPNAGNPGGLNTENDFLTPGWTTIISESMPANSWSGIRTLPFAFDFYETPVTHFKISGNGVLTFDTTAVAIPVSENTNLPAPPSANIPDKSILGFWDAFNSAGTGPNDYVQIRTFGTAPNRQFWVRYTSYDFEDLRNVYWAIVLEETSNKIYVIDTYRPDSFIQTSYTIGAQLNASSATQFGDSTLSLLNTSFVSTDNSYYEFNPAMENDASIFRLNTPSRITTPGLKPVTAILSNNGKNNLNSANIHWEINGLSQTSTSFTGNLSPGQQSIVSLGTYNFPSGNTLLKIWSSDPNGLSDSFTPNDTLLLKVCTPLTGTYTIGATGADFNHITEAVDALKNCGVSGPVLFKVEEGTYTGSLRLTEIAGADTINTITFRGESRENTIITHDGSGVLGTTIDFDGADYFIFRNLTIKNTNFGSTSRAVQFLNQADYNTLDSCNVQLLEDYFTSNSSVICLTSSRFDFFGNGNNGNHCTIKNCLISGGHVESQ